VALAEVDRLAGAVAADPAAALAKAVARDRFAGAVDAADAQRVGIDRGVGVEELGRRRAGTDQRHGAGGKGEAHRTHGTLLSVGGSVVQARGSPMKRRNSERVRASSRKPPSIFEVTMLTPRLCTPRVVMHSWLASTTTPTPRGLSTSWMTAAICAVIFSCTWKRRA